MNADDMPSQNATHSRPSDELIAQLAADAGLGNINLAPEYGFDLYAGAIRRFALIVAEECAKVCDEQWAIDGTRTAQDFASAIRANFGITK